MSTILLPSNRAQRARLANHPTRQALLDDIINAVNLLSSRAIDSVESFLCGAKAKNIAGFVPKKKDVTDDCPDPVQSEIDSGTHKLETLLNTSIDKSFDLFELYVMKNIITVNPEDQPFMRLSHYEALDFAASTAPDRATLSSINALRRRLQASQRMQAALEAERLRNEALLVKLRAALGATPAIVKKEDDEAAAQQNVLGFLRDRGRLAQGGSEAPIATTAEFTISQLQSLREVSSALRRILPHLDIDRREDDEADKSWRAERAEYIESSSRRYLEREAGLELGTEGELRDGEWQGGGVGLAKGQVGDLENVVNMLGAGETQEGDEMEES